jgi:hypothetical protein
MSITEYPIFSQYSISHVRNVNALPLNHIDNTYVVGYDASYSSMFNKVIAVMWRRNPLINSLILRCEGWYEYSLTATGSGSLCMTVSSGSFSATSQWRPLPVADTNGQVLTTYIDGVVALSAIEQEIGVDVSELPLGKRYEVAVFLGSGNSTGVSLTPYSYVRYPDITATSRVLNYSSGSLHSTYQLENTSPLVASGSHQPFTQTETYTAKRSFL